MFAWILLFSLMNFQILKFLKYQKILKNQMIHYLEIIETKQNIYDLTTEKYKRKFGYIQKNNPSL